jgi:hypothetical protein
LDDLIFPELDEMKKISTFHSISIALS